MPIYEYRRPDGSTFEVQQSFSDDQLKTDPDTGVPVERVLHAPAVHFKGKGFYNTDYGTRKRQRENAASAEGSPSGSSGESSSGEGSSDSSSKGDTASKGDSSGKSDTKKSETSAPHSGTGGGQGSKPEKKTGESKPLAAAK
jgi:putative FmdB family regulatory protein